MLMPVIRGMRELTLPQPRLTLWIILRNRLPIQVVQQIVPIIQGRGFRWRTMLGFDVILVKRPVARKRILRHEHRVGAVHRDVVVVEVERGEEEAIGGDLA